MKFQSLLILLFLVISSVACGQIDKNTSPADKPAVARDDQQTVVQVVNIQKFKEVLSRPDAQLIDVRTDAEVAEGMISGALQMDVADWNEFVTATESLDPNKPVLVYCKSGGRSNSAATFLVENGFTEVYDLKGGITAWDRNNEKTVKP